MKLQGVTALTALLVIIYVSFISLGLPDSILGSIWPTVQQDLSAGFSVAGYISMTVTAGTIVSSLFSDSILRRFSTGKVTAVSVAATALALFGYAAATHVFWLFFWAIPLGLGAGCVDVALNNYVSVHYEAKHMSWLHCFWGIGASAGPAITGFILRSGGPWRSSYLLIAVVQAALCVWLFASLRLWKQDEHQIAVTEAAGGSLALLKTKGIFPVMMGFLFYCAIEASAGLWCTSYVHRNFGLPAADAAISSTLFYGGITFGRFLSGFGAKKFRDETLIRAGVLLCCFGIAMVLIASAYGIVWIGIFLAGSGLAPIYPAMLHITPRRFGIERSQAAMGLELTCAYVGLTAFPPLLGSLASYFGIRVYPWFLTAIALLLLLSTELAAKFKKAASE